MASWIDLLVKQLLLLVLLASIGFGPAALLRGEAAVGSRLALAPVLGLALAACALGTASYLMPMKVAAWAVLLPLACLSLAAGLVARRRQGVKWITRARLIDIAQIAAVLIVVAAAINYPLAKRDSLGPVGYTVGDAAGYVAIIDGLKDNTLQDVQFGPPWDLTDEYAAGYAAGFQQIGLDAVGSASASLFGWGATEMQTSLMITVILIGALGLFASVRGLTETRTPAAMLAGALFAGPLFYQLLLEGSESALDGIALVVPFGMVGMLTLRDPCLRNLLVLGLLGAGIQTLYPLLVPAVAAWTGLVLVILAVRAFARSQLNLRLIGKASAAVAAVAIVAIALTPVAFSRNADYWKTVATTDFLESNNESFPKYNLPVDVLPSYVLQSREFYFLSRPTLDEPKDWALTVVAPALLIYLALFGAWRFRRSAVLLALFPGAAVLAYSAYSHDDCSYCLQRSLLIMGPTSAALLAVGVAGVASWRPTTPPRLRRVLSDTNGLVAAGAALALALMVVVLSGHKTKVMIQRAINGAYAAPPELRDLMPSLRDRRGVIALEEAGADQQGVFEAPAFYHAVNEQTSNRLAIDSANYDHYALAYIGGPRPAGPRFVPNYRWVVTRVGDVRTPRTTVAKRGPFAFQRVNGSADVTLSGGFVADSTGRPGDGQAWVAESKLRFLVDAPPNTPAWLRLDFVGPPVRLVSPSDGQVIERSANKTSLCIPAEGRRELRRVRIKIAFRQGSPKPPPKLFGVGVPPKRLRLGAAAATTHDCLTRP